MDRTEVDAGCGVARLEDPTEPRLERRRTRLEGGDGPQRSEVVALGCPICPGTAGIEGGCGNVEPDPVDQSVEQLAGRPSSRRGRFDVVAVGLPSTAAATVEDGSLFAEPLQADGAPSADQVDRQPVEPS